MVTSARESVLRVLALSRVRNSLSMKVGELVLFPAISQEQALNGTVSVAAPGTSCREQIADGTGVAAQHPIVLISNLLPQT